MFLNISNISLKSDPFCRPFTNHEVIGCQDNQRLYPEECYRQMLQWREVRATDGALGNPGKSWEYG